MLFKTALVLAFSFLTLAVIHFIKKHFSRAYFSLGEIVVSETEVVTLAGLAAKFGPPLVLGFLLSIAIREDTLNFIVLYGFLASFLAVWPAILCPAAVLSEQARKRRNSLYFIYFLYVMLYVMLSILGYNIFLLASNVRSLGIFSFLQRYGEFYILSENMITGVISGIVVLALARFYRTTMRKLRRTLRAEDHHDTERDAEVVS